MSLAANRRLAVAGVLLALVVFGLFFAIGRGGREPTRTTAVESAATAGLGDESPEVGAVTGTSGAIPGLRPRPEPVTDTTTGPSATTGTSSTATTATTAPSTSTTTGTSTSSPPPTSGTSTTSPPTTSGTTN